MTSSQTGPRLLNPCSENKAVPNRKKKRIIIKSTALEKLGSRSEWGP